MIVVGADTHKDTHTAVAVNAATGQLLGERTAAARRRGFIEHLDWSRELADGQEVVWAIEDCRHVSGAIERFLVAAGERVVRVPPKLMGKTRKGERRRGKSDPIDATNVARAALQEGVDSLPVAFLDSEAMEIKLLADHREDLVRSRAQDQQRLRWHLHEIDPDYEIPAGVERFDSDAKLVRLAGVAPIPASSGRKDRHRLDRGGNRQLNCAFHRVAVTQGRIDERARAYLERKQAEGMSRKEALRSLKRPSQQCLQQDAAGAGVEVGKRTHVYLLCCGNPTQLRVEAAPRSYEPNFWHSEA